MIAFLNSLNLGFESRILTPAGAGKILEIKKRLERLYLYLLKKRTEVLSCLNKKSLSTGTFLGRLGR
jgi:hypothetical protein